MLFFLFFFFWTKKKKEKAIRGLSSIPLKANTLQPGANLKIKCTNGRNIKQRVGGTKTFLWSDDGPRWISLRNAACHPLNHSSASESVRSAANNQREVPVSWREQEQEPFLKIYRISEQKPPSVAPHPNKCFVVLEPAGAWKTCSSRWNFLLHRFIPLEPRDPCPPIPLF